MRANELDYILTTMLDSNKDVSDLNITVDKPLQVESSGQLVGVHRLAFGAGMLTGLAGLRYQEYTKVHGG